MCDGGKCPLRENCQRYSEFADKYVSRLLTPPYTIKKGLFDCDSLITKNQVDLLEEIKNKENE